MDIWIPNIGNVIVEKEKNNLYDEYAVCIRNDERNLSKTFSQFLSLPTVKIDCVVTGRHVNRGAGYGLEIPVQYTFTSHEKMLDWTEKVVKRILDVSK